MSSKELVPQEVLAEAYDILGFTDEKRAVAEAQKILLKPPSRMNMLRSDAETLKRLISRKDPLSLNLNQPPDKLLRAGLGLIGCAGLTFAVIKTSINYEFKDYSIVIGMIGAGLIYNIKDTYDFTKDILSRKKSDSSYTKAKDESDDDDREFAVF